MNLIESIKGKKLKLITVTQNPQSRLAQAADVVLNLKVEESDHKHMLPTASIIAIIAIFDAIADELTKCPQFSDEAFYLNHNHGSVSYTHLDVYKRQDPSKLGVDMEIDVIAATVIGGTPITGGYPNIIGTVCGAFSLQLITMMCNMNNVAYSITLMIKAAIIVFALFFHGFRKK